MSTVVGCLFFDVHVACFFSAHSSYSFSLNFFVCNTFFVAAGGISTQNVNAKTNRMYVPIDFMNEKFSFTPHRISWIEMDCNCMPSNNNCCLEKWRSSGCFVCLCVFGFFSICVWLMRFYSNRLLSKWFYFMTFQK